MGIPKEADGALMSYQARIANALVLKLRHTVVVQPRLPRIDRSMSQDFKISIAMIRLVVFKDQPEIFCSSIGCS